jgi:hypothetical protein
VETAFNTLDLMRERSTSPGGATPERELAWLVDAVAAVVRSSLDDTEPQFPALEDCNSAAVARAVRRHRVATLLASGLTEGQLPSDVARRIRNLRNDDVRRGMRLEAESSMVARTLVDAGVPHLMVKGVALAAALGGDPSSRGGGDIDVWVDECHLAAAEAALSLVGWCRIDHGRGYDETPGSRRWKQMLRERSEVMLVAPSRSIVDLHWRLADRSRDLTFNFDSARSGSVTVSVGGVEVRTLAPHHALEHLAVHARKEEWATLRHVVDVARAALLLSSSERADAALDSTDVRRALAVASHLVPRLRPDGLTSTDQRIVDESWRRLLHGRPWELFRRRLVGLPALRVRLDYESWMIRSAPGTRAALGRLRRTAWKVRLLVDPRRRPWRGKAVFDVGRSVSQG